MITELTTILTELTTLITETIVGPLITTITFLISY